MNTPSLDGGNWRWRFDPQDLTRERAAKLALLIELSDRLPQPVSALSDENFAA
jgi:4-alpha-glucanotransferase